MLNTFTSCAPGTQYRLHMASFPWQAHMQARFVILRVLLEAGEGLVTVTPTTGSDGRPDARVHLDRSKIRSVGKPALARFLRTLQVREDLSSWLPTSLFPIPPSHLSVPLNLLDSSFIQQVFLVTQ